MISPIELQLMEVGLAVATFCAIYAVVYSMVEASRRRKFEQQMLSIISGMDKTILDSQAGIYEVLLSIDKRLQNRY